MTPSFVLVSQDHKESENGWLMASMTTEGYGLAGITHPAFDGSKHLLFVLHLSFVQFASRPLLAAVSLDSELAGGIGLVDLHDLLAISTDR